jgi:hypothetical protein
MFLYEFVTPSDPITFKAENDKIAFCCALILGSGKACCTNVDSGESIPSLLIFSTNPEKEIEDFLGSAIDVFMKDHLKSVSESFSTFAYGKPSERKTYDAALEAITDAEKLKEFKSKHEDVNRSSMSKWVQHAWKLSEKILIQK